MGLLNKYLFIFTMYKFRNDFLTVADSADLPWEVCAQTPGTVTTHTWSPPLQTGALMAMEHLCRVPQIPFILWVFLKTFEPQDNFGKAFCDSLLMLGISQMDIFEIRKKILELGWNRAPEARLNSGILVALLLLDLSDSLQKSDRNTGSLLPMSPISHVANSHIVPKIAP